MEKKITNTDGIDSSNSDISIAAVIPNIPIIPITPIQHTIDTYTVNNSGTKSTGSVAYCDSNRSIHCNISITPGAKFKSIKRVLLLLSNNTGASEGFAVYKALSNTILEGRPFAYVANRYNSNNSISHRVIDISDFICGSKTQTIHIAIQSIDGNYLSVNTASTTLEVEYLEDDDFIPNVSKFKGGVGAKGAYSVNTRNGKLFYTQNLIVAKGGRMPLGLSLTYNAADCDNSSPNGMSAGIKGWTFNYAQTLKTSSTSYTLLDGAHKYRTFEASTNNSAYKFDKSGKSGAYLVEDSTGYTVSDGKATTYKFSTNKRLTQITVAGGASVMTTAITYNSNGTINTITDGMGDVYSFAYATNSITISRGTTALVELTLSSTRLTQVKYLLSGETYSFTYNTNGELLTVTETALDKKCVFAHSDAGEVTAIKNYVYKNNVTSPTDSYHFYYAPLKTSIGKCRNSDIAGREYSSTIYHFAENGETIFVCEDGESGAFKNMHFREKNDYEKYSSEIIDIANSEHAAAFLFNNKTTYACETTQLGATHSKASNTLVFDSSTFKSDSFIITAKALINANSYISTKDVQYITLTVKEGNTIVHTLNFDAQRRGYQVKSAMITLPRGVHSLTAELKIYNMRADIEISDFFIFETSKGKRLEYVDAFTDNTMPEEVDKEGKSWFLNRGGYTLTSGTTQVPGVKYTAKDYILTTISRLKNPNSFNVWYNDGENMLGGVSSAYLVKNSVTQSITSVRCSILTKGIEKTVFMATKPSSKTGAMLSETITTRINIGDGAEENTFFTTGVEYNSYMKPIEVTDEDGIVTEYTYNDFGEELTEKVFPSTQPTLNTLLTKEYSGGNLSAVKEKRLTTEYTHTFNYNSDDTLNYEITPGGQYIYRSYAADREKLSQLRATVSGSLNSNNMTYTGDLLNTATHNATTITFGYDDRNNINCVNIAGSGILSKTTTYNSYGTTEVVIEYSNGAKIKTYYDEYNRLIRVTDVTGTETEICAYIYSDKAVSNSIVSPTDLSLSRSANSKLYAFIDTAAGNRTNYVYDEYGNLKETQTGTIKNTLIRDNFNRPKISIFYGPTKTLQREVVYENDKTNRIISEKLSLGANLTHINYTRDALKRISEIKTVRDGNGYARKFFYTVRGPIPIPEGTTNYVGSVSYYNMVNDVSTLEKTEGIVYNADGNIITYGDNTYVYDNLGRLLRENNKALDKTFLFVYNVGGNIVSKTEYAYTTGTVGTAIKTYNYTYGNAWKDQLTAFDGSAITYDASGNPTSYLGKTLTWGRGRLLTKYVSGSNTVEMQYDGKGMRIGKSKKIGSTTTNSTYTYDNSGKLRTEVEGSTTRNYIYGQDGIVGYEENGEQFMYRKNFFGDITAIYQGTTKIAEYSYDAWGNCTITTNVNGYGTRNPFRYRGYYFDTDLNMYYLMTRYYDPQIGRFINADTINYLKPNSINGLNLYAYCKNNPTRNIDPLGTAEYVCWDESGKVDPDEWTNRSAGGGNMHGTNRFCSDSGTMNIVDDGNNDDKKPVDNSPNFDPSTLIPSDIDWSGLGEKAIFYVEQGVYYTKAIVVSAVSLPAVIIFVPLMYWAEKTGVVLSSNDVAGAAQTMVSAAGNYTDSRLSGRASSGIGDKIVYSMFGDDETGFYDFLE